MGATAGSVEACRAPLWATPRTTFCRHHKGHREKGLSPVMNINVPECAFLMSSLMLYYRSWTLEFFSFSCSRQDNSGSWCYNVCICFLYFMFSREADMKNEEEKEKEKNKMMVMYAPASLTQYNQKQRTMKRKRGGRRSMMMGMSASASFTLYYY